MQNTYTQVINLIDLEILKSRESSDINIQYKLDKSLVTKVDINIQTSIIEYIKDTFPSIKLIVAEEFHKYGQNLYDFTSDYLILDPIDGTENFAAGIPMFGFALSLHVNDNYLDMIYIPSMSIGISNLSDHNCVKPHFTNNICLASTKCLENNSVRGQNIRVMGSSSYMFYLFLTGKVKRYVYCGGAKIWDCYSGLRLSNQLGAKIKITGSEYEIWRKTPSFLTEFEVSW